MRNEQLVHSISRKVRHKHIDVDHCIDDCLYLAIGPVDKLVNEPVRLPVLNAVIGSAYLRVTDFIIAYLAENAQKTFENSIN